MPWGFFCGRSVHEISRQVDRIADDLATAQALLQLANLFIVVVATDDEAERSKSMPNRFGLANTRPARASNGTLDQSRCDYRRVIGRRQNQRDRVATLASEPFGEGKPGRKRRTRVESPPWTQTDQKDRAGLEPRHSMESGQFAQRARQVLIADQARNDRFQRRPARSRRGFDLLLEDSQNQPLCLDR